MYLGAFCVHSESYFMYDVLLHMSVCMGLIEGALDGTAIYRSYMLLNNFRYYITIMMLVYEVINHAKQTLHDISQNHRELVYMV